ncbi:hypothetical protein V6N13_029590 [Hibiscus sabdariffa]|uniref:Uncharacterized protein n=2 Tax=Hibiscus sabdariffa TaxID=183260 RepID=A0ABR2AH04_9ROSI
MASSTDTSLSQNSACSSGEFPLVIVSADALHSGRCTSTLPADTSSLARVEVVGVDTRLGPDGSKVHHSQLGHLAGSVDKELNNETGLISEGTSSSSLPSLQQEAGKEIAMQSPICDSLQQEPEEETTAQFHVDHHPSGSFQRHGVELALQSGSETDLGVQPDSVFPHLDDAMSVEDVSQPLEFQSNTTTNCHPMITRGKKWYTKAQSI